MRRELLTCFALLWAACFVGDEEPAREDTSTDTDAGLEPRCEGCPCDVEDRCDAGLRCDWGTCVAEDMVFVPAGPFLRGCDVEPCELDELPIREINLSAYALDATEVTVADYQTCVTATDDPCSLPAQPWPGEDSPLNFGAPERDDHPVNGVTWSQAAHYCERLGRRLPTEAEWEKAAGGVSGSRYPWGPAAPTCERAQLAIGSPGCGAGATAPVGERLTGKSPYGALDMAGNVAEWTADFYAPDSYATSPPEDPPGPSTGTSRVIRGGSWISAPSQATTFARDAATEGGSAQIGFRCARSIP